MAADNVDVGRLHTGPRQGQPHAFRLPVTVGQHEVAGVGVHCVADDLAVNLRAAGQRIGKPLEDAQPAPFGDDNPVAVLVERAGGLRRIVVMGQSPFRLKAGEDAKRVDALRNAPRDRQIDLAQPQHLDAVNQIRRCRPHRPRRPSNADP